MIGCVSYSTQVNRSEQRGNIEVKLDSVTVKRGGDSQLTFTVNNIPSGIKLLAGFITSDNGLYCESGLAAEKVGRSSGKSIEDALVSGEQISITFFDNANHVMTGESPRLDLLVETPKSKQRCIPMPTLLNNLKQPLQYNIRRRKFPQTAGRGDSDFSITVTSRMRRDR